MKHSFAPRSVGSVIAKCQLGTRKFCTNQFNSNVPILFPLWNKVRIRIGFFFCPNTNQPNFADRGNLPIEGATGGGNLMVGFVL